MTEMIMVTIALPLGLGVIWFQQKSIVRGVKHELK